MDSNMHIKQLELEVDELKKEVSKLEKKNHHLDMSIIHINNQFGMERERREEFERQRVKVINHLIKYVKLLQEDLFDNPK